MDHPVYIVYRLLSSSSSYEKKKWTKYTKHDQSTPTKRFPPSHWGYKQKFEYPIRRVDFVAGQMCFPCFGPIFYIYNRFALFISWIVFIFDVRLRCYNVRMVQFGQFQQGSAITVQFINTMHCEWIYFLFLFSLLLIFSHFTLPSFISLTMNNNTSSTFMNSVYNARFEVILSRDKTAHWLFAYAIQVLRTLSLWFCLNGNLIYEFDWRIIMIGQWVD